MFTSILLKLKHHIEVSLDGFYTDGHKTVHLFNHIVSSEDIKLESGADFILCERQIDVGVVLVKDGDWIGYIDDYGAGLGSDIVIKNIHIYNNKKLSKELTNKWHGFLMVCSRNNDMFVS